ncbi:ComF family protein [Acinetobacter equi]|uniref:Competence protein ComF n=1 Tax=Acinetobacter equi TaxID=1324350 RepID=A0A0N9V5H9_9GAMM|nr:phosphoribosyltransferase family protein [Acinetobacter equi]ALH94485.1 competence protein ComF [Acinetobacter equi]
MLMFNLFSKSKNLITPILRCQLCSLDSQYKATICKDCWTQIPWETEKIIKQEVPIFVACRYEYPINRIIQKFKYEQQLHFQHLLANLILQLHLPKVQAIVPMPISEERLIERGYNQSLEVAKIVAKILNIPIWQPIQRMHQHSQKGLTRLERIENIQSQFQIKKDYKIRYKRVLILDDVVTTGSSILALMQSLEQLGCQKIFACAIANAN